MCLSRLIHSAHPVQMMHPGEVLEDLDLSHEGREERVPEEHDFAAELGDVTVGAGEEFVLRVHGLERSNSRD